MRLFLIYGAFICLGLLTADYCGWDLLNYRTFNKHGAYASSINHK